FKISVYARFRPLGDSNAIKNGNATNNDTGADGGHEVEVTLPLYQRLAMIKMSHNLKSNRDALRVLTSEGGWFQAKWTELEDKENQKNENRSTSNASSTSPSRAKNNNNNSLNSFYSQQKIPQISVKKTTDRIVA